MRGDVDLVYHQSNKSDGANDNQGDNIAGIPPAGCQASEAEWDQEHGESGSQQKSPAQVNLGAEVAYCDSSGQNDTQLLSPALVVQQWCYQCSCREWHDDRKHA